MIKLQPTRNPTKYKTIMGFDTSSKKIAWTVVKNGKPVSGGKFDLPANVDILKKLPVIISELKPLIYQYKPDHIFIEKPIYVRSHQTAIILSYVVSCCVTIFIQQDIEVTQIEPMVHKNFLGYTAINRNMTLAAQKKLGKLEAKKFLDRMRKEQGQRIIKKNFPKFDVADNDISDACSVALYGYNSLAKPLQLQISQTIAFSPESLAILGL